MVCSRGQIYKVIFNSTGTVKKVIRISDTPIHERGCVLYEIDGYIWFFHQGKMCRISEIVEKSQEPQPVSVSLNISSFDRYFVFIIVRTMCGLVQVMDCIVMI